MIRTARPSDMVEVKALGQKLRTSFGPARKMENLGPMPDLSNFVATGRVFILREGAIKAFMISYPSRNCYYIDRIELTEKAQRDGSPRKLMTFAEARALEQDCKYIGIWDNPWMEDYMAFCKSQGYHVTNVPEGGLKDRVYFEM